MSDRESLYMNPGDHASNIAHARSLVADGKDEEMMPRSAFWAPITALRYLALFDVRSAAGETGPNRTVAALERTAPRHVDAWHIVHAGQRPVVRQHVALAFGKANAHGSVSMREALLS